MKYNIYSLRDPLTFKIRYVGRTKGSIYKRLAQHLSEAYERERLFKEKGQWIIMLMQQNKMPIVELLEVTESANRESYWIQALDADLNVVLTNDSRMSSFRRLIKSKPVYQYTLKGQFIQRWPSAIEVERSLNIEATNVSACAHGSRKKAGEFLWKFELFASVPYYQRNVITRVVHQYTLDGVFVATHSSLTGVEGFTTKGICKCCRGDCNSHRGFKFSYVKI